MIQSKKQFLCELSADLAYHDSLMASSGARREKLQLNLLQTLLFLHFLGREGREQRGINH
ncbi:hypothetical protein ACHRVW_14340 [Flavobacterium collinsii]|uniref:hypothetical protein n=1 Tax=Flavobacterium collinsii TaxID=1114861 RepID=UPI0037564641